MPILTLKAQIEAEEESQAIILDAMYCATKVYNGLVWYLREEYKATGQSDTSKKNLNRLLKMLPRAKGYYSLSAQATRDEVIQAYQSFFALRRAGRTQHNAPGFRRKTQYSPLRYYEGYGFSVQGDRLTISLGTSRADGVKSVAVTIRHRPAFAYRRIVNLLLTYDIRHGLYAHLVVEVDARQPKGNHLAAVDLGETQALCAVFDDGKALLVNGRFIKALRRYWQKVRAKVKPPTLGQKKSKRYSEIERKERRQVEQILHNMSKFFVNYCYHAGVSKIAIGNLTGIREHIDYGDRLNQRLHAWPYAKITAMIRYKAALYGIEVIQVSESYTSQTCHNCHTVAKANRKTRGSYHCSCGWRVQADINGALNIFQCAFQVSPLRRSGAVAAPVVLPVYPSWHTVYKTRVWQSMS